MELILPLTLLEENMTHWAAWQLVQWQAPYSNPLVGLPFATQTLPVLFLIFVSVSVSWDQTGHCSCYGSVRYGGYLELCEEERLMGFPYVFTTLILTLYPGSRILADLWGFSKKVAHIWVKYDEFGFGFSVPHSQLFGGNKAFIRPTFADILPEP